MTFVLDDLEERHGVHQAIKRHNADSTGKADRRCGRTCQFSVNLAQIDTSGRPRWVALVFWPPKVRQNIVRPALLDLVRVDVQICRRFVRMA